ncbi:hypothetical protein PsYK624_069160 [Phanerochaete sordida]|uniref:Uncharacterized protein n=1 Tax=Phanerochaete sordida TaxID=48140 RepID=A0A9P3G7M9_9APHY|nr:hypothetical protein PsYK624_069160 [Phanerochaete sordida]
MSIDGSSSSGSNGAGSSRTTHSRSDGRTPSPQDPAQSGRRQQTETPQGAVFAMDTVPESTSSSRNAPRRDSLSFARRTDTYATSPQPPPSSGGRSRRPSQSVLVDSGYNPRPSQRPSPATSSPSSGRSSVNGGRTGTRTASIARMPTEDIEASLAIPRPVPSTASSSYPTYTGGSGFPVQGELAGPYGRASGSPPHGQPARTRAGDSGGGSPQTNGTQPSPHQQRQQHPYGIPQQNANQQPPLGSSVVPYNPYLFPYPGTDTNPYRPNGSGNYHGRPPRR